jgi:hypothetical protein
MKKCTFAWKKLCFLVMLLVQKEKRWLRKMWRLSKNGPHWSQ